MTPKLQIILDHIQQAENISATEKELLIKTIHEADKAQSMVQFKLERIEKDRNTLSIMLEETIDDLQKKNKAVEAQNRELEIESSLERVRTAALAMKEPADMPEVCKIITQQLDKLGVKEIRNVQTAIFYESRGAYMNYEYYAKHDKTVITETTYTNHKIQQEFADKMLKGPGEISITHIPGGELKDWIAYQKTTNVFIDSFLETAPSLNYYWHSLGPVALGISTYIPLKDEELSLFKKFLNVFELAYTRYLDIEQAIAQAREAKIEAALERVRARTMAMQNSNELPAAANLLFQQMQALGMPAWSTGYCIWNEDGKSVTLWMSSEGVLQPAFTAPTTEDELFIQMRKGHEKGKTLHVVELGGEKLAAHYQYMRTLPVVGEILDSIIEAGHPLPTFQVMHYAYFSKGYLLFITYEPVPVAHDIFKRFAFVFDQTYTRFLDLQKAEAQAREAKIETALERVRARTMAMQRSEELAETVTVLFQQFSALGESPERMAIEIVNEKENVFEIWATQHGGLQLNQLLKASLDEPHVMQKMYVAWKTQTKSITIDLQEKELEEYFQYLKNAGLPVQREIFGTRRVQNVATFSKGILTIITPEPRPQKTIDILERFAAVFDGTYTRFLDLQKAEAQAREAQIEAALERVRSRSMGMQKSDELQEVIKLVYQQLINININLDHAGFVVDYKPKRDWTFWIADEQDIPSKITHPYFESVWATQFNEAKENGEDLFVTNLNFEEKNKFYNELLSYVSGLSQASKDFYLNCPGLAASTVLFDDVALYIENFSGTPYSDEENKILMRFGKVFQQTYTRFLDLQKAEAQAREAQIETALEKVRSRTLAMQKSDELAETAAEVFRQLISLGIEPNRLYIGIVKEQSGDMEMWATDEDGTHVGKKFMFNKDENASVKKLYDGWATKQKSVIVDMQGKELEDYFHYLNHVMHIPFKGGLTQKRRVQSVAYFSSGFIGMASPDGQGDQTIQLLERFAAVFNLTFTRFNDLKIAEAHAQQAEQDLIAIKESRQKAEEALTELQATQKQLIQSEKMASLGELTAGIAHEIQNPLNFVNNFSDVSTELVDEMNTELEKGNLEDAKQIAQDLKQNLEKINHHGKRAGDIVKGMLQHSRSSSGVKEPTNINALADEYLRLAYHGLRAKDKSFNATMKTDFDETIGNINVIPQDMGRVILNLITNAFYVVDEKKKLLVKSQQLTAIPYEPTVTVSTKKMGDKVEVKVKDNGNGIPQKVIDKIFQPFFTTKPTGQGTGLGLSLSYDIVKAHGGEIKVETKENEGTEFIIQLPII